MKQSKRLLSLLLSASIATGMLPAVALADEVDEQIISIDEEQIAADVADAADSQDAIVIDDGSEDAEAAEAESAETEEIDVDSEESVAIDVSDQEAEQASYVYGMMNVPYKDFWALYTTDDVALNANSETGKNIAVEAAEADAVSTATTAFKAAAGSYNDGSVMRGVTIPVAVGSDDLETVQALEKSNGDYKFTANEDSAAETAAYSVVTVEENGSLGFTALQDSTVTTDYLSVAESTSDGFTTSIYGDYEIDIDGIDPPKGGIKVGDSEYKAITIYGAILNVTDEGKTQNLGMTINENTWYGSRKQHFEIAWSIKEGSQKHQNHNRSEAPLYYQFDHNGGTLNSVTLITSLGVIKVNSGLELPEYYSGDLSGLDLSITNDSKVLNISGVPTGLENVTVSVSDDLAKNATISNDQIALADYPVDGTNYTVTISSSNYPDITKTVSTPITQDQITELKRWIEKANAAITAGASNEADLQAHVEEAEELIANTAATSYDAATLIGELTDKVKVNYNTATATATLKGSTLTVGFEEIELSDLVDPTYTVAYRAGRNFNTLASGKLDDTVVGLDAEPTAGTEYTLTIVSDNYQDITTTVTAEAEQLKYVQMNVPYTDFWANYKTTDIALNASTAGEKYESQNAAADAVSTATTGFKAAAGSYNDGSVMRGVTIPVAVSEENYAKLKTDLTAKDDYYFTDLDEAPAAYSKLTIKSNGTYRFSALQDSDVTTKYLSVEENTSDGFTTSVYGDYQIDIQGIEPPKGGIKVGDSEYKAITIYGAILHITDKDNVNQDLGMTINENTWYGSRKTYYEISWSIKNGGQKHQNHNNSSAPLYYQFNTNGGTLNSVTLLTSLGVIEVNDSLDLPAYYDGEGDLTKLSLGLASNSKELSISNVPSDLKDVTVSVSGDLAKNAAIVNGKVQLTGTPVDGTKYTVTIHSSNYADITAAASTTISQAQKDELQKWIDKANAVYATASNKDGLTEHIGEAQAMIKAGTDSSYDAAELISELMALVKANYPTATATATLKGTALTVGLSVDLSKLEDPTYTVAYRAGRNFTTLASGSLNAATVALDKAPTVGTEYTLTITSGNYQDITTKVTAADKDAQTITTSKDSYSLTYGGAAVALGASAKSALTYSSSNKSVATVDANGKVTAVGAGTATITIKAAESAGYKAASKTVTVTVAAASQTITVGAASYSKTYGAAAFSLGAKTNGNGKLTYKSSNTAVATVDAAGKVTLKGKGTATITVSAAATSQYKAASKTVTVKVAAASQTITATKTSYSKAYGAAAFSLGAKTSGNGKLTYSSSKTSVATVSSAGKVTIKGVGTTTITVKAAATNQYNAASKTIKVTVTKGASTITAKSYTKAYGAKAFSLGAKNSGNGKLSYTSSNKKVATVSSSGKITIKGVGKATITIKAAATTKYKSASKKVTITVNPAKTSISNLKNVKTKKMTVKWAKKSSATGYQIYYSTSSSFKTYKKTTSTSASKTISGLTKGKTYYVKVRGYKKVSGKTYYASWSTAKKVKITK